MTDKIQKFINSLDKKLKQKLIARIFELIKNPHQGTDIKKLKGVENMYRLRMGNIRVVYIAKKENIEIIAINYRGNIY